MKRSTRGESSTNEPPRFSVIPSPTTEAALQQQQQMMVPNGGNILYPPRTLPQFPELTDEQSALADSFLDLEKRYKASEWYALCDSAVRLPPLSSAQPQWTVHSPEYVTPAATFKHASYLLDPPNTSDLCVDGSSEYLTRALLRDSIVTLSRLMHPRHGRKIRSRSPEYTISDVLQKVSLKEITDGMVSPADSHLEEQQSGFESEADSMASEEEDRNYEDYF
mmetsp:Transcript_33267/g.52004  ORF Transcript_33267/g.52004 Transcript_33267/m.52004 type:complete len:222 (-) Transcript_33267:22-687(-)